MLGLRRAVCEILGCGVRSGSLSGVLVGRQLVRGQPWSGEKRSLPAASSSLLQVARTYAKTRHEEPSSQLDDLPPTMIKKDYVEVQKVEEVNDVVKRLLSLEMASQSDKLKVKIQQFVDKVKRPDQEPSSEVHIAILAARIQNLKEHMQKHPKDKANKRRMLMTIDQHRKMLKNLRLTNYELFEHICKQLNIEYTFPQEVCRRRTKKWLAKKAFCLKVHEQVMKQKAAKLLQEKLKQSRAKPTPVQS